jgi:purine-nucleoside phosphorylase
MNEKLTDYGYLDACKGSELIRKRLEEKGMNPDQVKDGVILGSGLGNFARKYLKAGQAGTDSGPVVIPFDEIYSELRLPVVTSRVPGHDQKLVIGPLDDQDDLIIAQCGREHPYEGVDTRRATFWLRIMQLLGVKTLLASNASGILTADTLTPPDLMMITGDQDYAANIDSPLLGANDDRFGPRFPHNGDLYSHSFREMAKDQAGQAGIDLKEGLFLRVKGPNYERAEDVYRLRSELREIWMTGAAQPGESRFEGPVTGVVGMSTTYELAVAQHASQSRHHPAFTEGKGAISVATNYAAALAKEGLAAFPSHEEVKENSAKVEYNFGRLVEAVLRGHQQKRRKQS